MKKKIIVFLIIVIGIIGFVIFNNRTVSTITLDINPSIRIDLARGNKVKNVVALNSDAKEIISNNLKGKTLDESLNIITENIIDKGYALDDQILVVLYSTGDIDNKELEKKVKKNFEEKNIYTEIVLIENVSKEDKSLAKKYNISPAKASYINSIVKENKNIEIKDLVDKSAKELKETKDTGNYCDSGYTLEGDKCLKEISRSKAKSGDVCPRGYFEENGICYEEVPNIGEEEYCEGNDELKDTNCVEVFVEEAEPQYSCSKGELIKKGDLNPIGSPDNEKYYCVDKSTGKEPILRCLTNSGHIMISGKCYNGPAPTINGGCPNGDTLVNGSCYSLDTYDQYVCPDGNIYEKSKDTYIDLCPDTFTYTEPTLIGYKCINKNATLSGTKCTYEDIKPILHKSICPDGYKRNKQERCINYSKTANKENGLVCEEENSMLRGNVCIIYEIIESKHN